MAGYNEIQVGRFNRLLQKLLSMKGPASMNELSTTLQLVLSIFHGVENRYLESWDRFAGYAVQGGVAAQDSAVKFRNPAGSNVIVVMEKLQFASSAASDVAFMNNQQPDTDLATISTNVNRLDPRGRPKSSMSVSSANNVAAVGTTAIGRISLPTVSTSTDFILFEEQEFPILPGDNLLVTNFTVNSTFICAFMWRERFLEDSERA